MKKRAHLLFPGRLISTLYLLSLPSVQHITPDRCVRRRHASVRACLSSWFRRFGLAGSMNLKPLYLYSTAPIAFCLGSRRCSSGNRAVWLASRTTLMPPPPPAKRSIVHGHPARGTERSLDAVGAGNMAPLLRSWVSKIIKIIHRHRRLSMGGRPCNKVHSPIGRLGSTCSYRPS